MKIGDSVKSIGDFSGRVTDRRLYGEGGVYLVDLGNGVSRWFFDWMLSPDVGWKYEVGEKVLYGERTFFGRAGKEMRLGIIRDRSTGSCEAFPAYHDRQHYWVQTVSGEVLHFNDFELRKLGEC